MVERDFVAHFSLEIYLAVRFYADDTEGFPRDANWIRSKGPVMAVGVNSNGDD